MIHADDPSALLETAFRRIQAERMADVPMLNDLLHVEALGFSRWRGHWLGVLITPWFMNLVLVPGSPEGWRSVADGARVFHRFPSGDFAFLGGREAELGEFQTCALFSPMDRFADQETARAVAAAALDALQKTADAKEAGTPAGSPTLDAGVKTLEEGVPPPPESRREFLNRIFMRRA